MGGAIRIEQEADIKYIKKKNMQNQICLKKFLLTIEYNPNQTEYSVH